MFQEEIKDAVKVDNGGMITNFYGNKIEDFYVEPDFNTFVITVKEESRFIVYPSNKDNGEELKNIVEKYNSDNGTGIKCYNGEGYCSLYFYDVKSPDTTAKELTELIKEKQLAEQIVYYSDLKSWSTGFFPTGSTLYYGSSNTDDLKKIEDYFIENDIEYRYTDEGAIIGGENLRRIEQWNIAVDIYKKTGACVTYFYLCDVNPEFSDSAVDMMNAVPGDANENGELDMSDAVFIMQCCSNPDKYQLTAQGRYNADFNNDGITNEDALAIQKILLEIE